MLRLKALGDPLQDHNVVLEQEVRSRTSESQRFRSATDATADAIFLISRADGRRGRAGALYQYSSGFEAPRFEAPWP